MNKELALSIIQLLSALESVGVIESNKMPDYLVDEIQIKIEALRKIVLEDK
jgi:hypothetical protein